MTVASTSREPRATAAGIVERSDTQQRVIPESRRADGSIRKERKVRPGFTPVEDVVRYRPARAREAEEARKRGTPGSEAIALTSSSSSPSALTSSSRPSVPAKSDSDGSTWRSSAARSPAASDGKHDGQKPRGNFAPFEPPKQPRGGRTSAATSPVPSEAPSSVAQSWRNSRLRKSQEPTTAVPEAWDQDEARHSGNSDKKPDAETVSARDRSSSADDLASQLDSLRIGKSKEAKDAES
ncbi:uncharacterized protein SRS1_15671 [Sporisorium reilianum f. sp. reilianum]|uniref:WIBG Mago-binding domain-containing protein n=1 Tax=Sporisorium reilianum f. sp. reilianum TaxID=72559 RepID=A0A2N8UKR3_9BASI|nr:uncharacterized protein SRS1_15671 [Sporisorium reilianum f. sp. reilianum]